MSDYWDHPEYIKLEKEIERLRESLEIAENAYDLLANTHNQQAAEIERMQPVIEAARGAMRIYCHVPDYARTNPMNEMFDLISDSIESHDANAFHDRGDKP